MTSVLLISMSLMLFPVEDLDEVSGRLEHAAEVLDELLNAPDTDVPEALVDQAECIAVLSDFRWAPFAIGKHALRGPVTCRTDAGWSAPSMAALDAPSYGFQFGRYPDFLLLFMVEDSAKKYLTDDVALGSDASADPGPEGSDLGSNSDITIDADILHYTRRRGFHERIAFTFGPSGPPRLRPDREANGVLYGREISSEEILLQGIRVPDLATGFMTAIRSN